LFSYTLIIIKIDLNLLFNCHVNNKLINKMISQPQSSINKTNNQVYPSMNHPSMNQIISDTFPHSNIIHSYSDNVNLYKIKSIDLIYGLQQQKILNWHMNRPADITRCKEISQNLYNTNKEMMGIIYLYYNKNHFEVLDGIHRLTALSLLKEENQNSDIHYLLEQYLIVNIRFNLTEFELTNVFANINNSVPVPGIYIEQYMNKIIIVNNIANDWQVKYKKHFSTSKSPIIGNTNINNFTDLLDKLYNHSSIPLNTKLYEINEKIKKNPPQKVSPLILKKCEETGCYLFLYKVDYIMDFII